LSRNHPFKKSQRRFLKNKVQLDVLPYFINGNKLWGFLYDFPKVIDGSFENLLGYKQFYNWTNRSIFWDPPYWKDKLLRQKLDVMHIEIFVLIMSSTL